MKIKTILGLITCAGACASYSAFANTTTNWFGASNAADIYGCSTTGVFTVESSRFVIDNELNDALTLTPSDTNPSLSDKYVVIDAKAELTPSTLEDLYDSTNELKTAEVKVGFAVATIDGTPLVSNFYGYANETWTKLTGDPDAAKVNGETEFTLKLDYRTNKVKFYVGGTLLTAAVGGAEEFTFGTGSLSLGNVAAYGSGTITSIDADYEIGTVAVGDVKYGSVADAIAAAGTEATIKDVDSTGAIATDETPTTADNGMPVAVCKALGLDTTDSEASVSVVPVNEDNNAEAITLRLDPQVNVEDGLVVKFQVKEGDTVKGTYGSNAIEIPLATGIYTVEPVSVELATP